jgi:hypothetical protein
VLAARRPKGTCYLRSLPPVASHRKPQHVGRVVKRYHFRIGIHDVCRGISGVGTHARVMLPFYHVKNHWCGLAAPASKLC